MKKGVNAPVRLLRLCARIPLTQADLEAIHALGQSGTVWDGMAERAEYHGLAPLLLQHLVDAGVAIPSTSLLQLRA